MKDKIIQLLSSESDKSIELGIVIGFNSVEINQDEIHDALLGNKSMLDRNQDEICEMCENRIIGGCSNSQFFQCEGRFCEDANDLFVEDFINDRL